MRLTLPETAMPQSSRVGEGVPPWQQELQKASAHFHIIGAWVAIIFDPLFAITDYLNIPEVWTEIFTLRLGVSVVTLITLWLYYNGKVNVYLLVAVPFALISLQNAYTYSLIESGDVLGHNLNYLALFLGAGLFVLWPWRYSVIAIGASFLTTLLFVAHNPAMQLSDLVIEGGLLLSTVAVFTMLLIQARYRLRISEIKAKLALKDNLSLTAAQKKEIEHQHRQLQEKTAALAASEAQVKAMNTQLEEKVQARTTQLQQANEEMDRLVYSLSHDFRTPLTNVKGLIHHARQCDNPARWSQLLDHMEQSTNRLDELQQDLINYAVYWNEHIDRKPVQVQEMVEQLWQQFGYAHNHSIELQLDPSLSAAWTFHTDQEKLRVVLYTLLSNSIRYQDAARNSTIRVSLEQVGEYVHLTIADNGIGIAEATLPSVCDMFFRGTNKSMGAGMGLYIAQNLMQQLGGTLLIDSVEGKGTQVMLQWPKRHVQPEQNREA